MNETGRDTNTMRHPIATVGAGGCSPLDKDARIHAALTATRYEEAVENLLPRIKYWICEHHDVADDDGEELAIETIRRGGDKISDFTGRGAFFSWVIGFAKLVVLEHYHDRPDHKALSLDGLVAERDTNHRPKDACLEESDAETIALKNMELDDIKGTLTFLEAAAHRLCFDEGCTYQEAASKIGGDATVNSIAKALQRATEKIGKRMKEQGYYP